MEALITNMKSPNVRRVIGRVRITRIGLTNTFRIPSISAAMSAGYTPVTVIPGINFATTIRAKALMRMRVRIEIIHVYYPLFRTCRGRQ